MWKAACEMFALATEKLFFRERDTVCLVKQEVSGHRRGGDGHGSDTHLTAEERSLTPTPRTIACAPKRLKISLPVSGLSSIAQGVCRAPGCCRLRAV